MRSSLALVVTLPFVLAGCGNAVVGGSTCDACGGGNADGSIDATVDTFVADTFVADAFVDAGGDTADTFDAAESASCPGATSCGSTCVDLATDDLHCGSCAKACTDSVCNGGTCRAIREGHVVVIGHDHLEENASASRLLANAVFISSATPVRILAWDEFADPIATEGAIKALNAAVASSGRTYARLSVSSVKTFAAKLDVASFDVALIFDQSKGTDAQLAGAGMMMKAALDSFIRAGGVVVVLDTSNAMPSLVGGAGLFTIGKQSSIAGGTLEVVAKDALARSLPLSYVAPARSIVMSVTDGPETTVPIVRDRASSLPVVLHRVVGKKP